MTQQVKPYRALILGANGLVGGFCLEELVNDPNCAEILLLTGRPLQITRKKLKIEVVDFDRLQDVSHLFSVDRVFCCLGTTLRKAGSREKFRQVDYSYPLQAALLANQSSSQKYMLVSALTANADSRIFYNRVKGELEEAISKIQFETILIFRPSFILGKRQETRPGETVGISIARLLSPFLLGRFKKYRPIHARVIASSMVNMASINLAGIHIFDPAQIQFFYDRVQQNKKLS